MQKIDSMTYDQLNGLITDIQHEMDFRNKCLKEKDKDVYPENIAYQHGASYYQDKRSVVIARKQILTSLIREYGEDFARRTMKKLNNHDYFALSCVASDRLYKAVLNNKQFLENI